MSKVTSRVRILDATLDVMGRVGLSGLALEDVAVEAGLSRQTLYRHFGSRDALITATILREEAELLELMRAASDKYAELEQSLAAAFETCITWARGHPLLDQLLAEDPEALLPFLIDNEGPVLLAARPLVEEVLLERLPDVDPDRVAADADAIARLLVSFAIASGGSKPSENAAHLAQLVCHGITRRT